MSKQLEYIIKKVLLEQFKTKPKLVTKTALLDRKAANFIKTEVCPKLGINPNALATDPRINGFQVVVERKGDISVNPDETEEILYTPEQLQEDVLDYLETSIGGVWARSRSTSYFWFISSDINSKDNKNEKKRATYNVVCTYIKADMINEKRRISINSSTTGWIKTFKQGGLVFDINKINISNWKVTPTIGVDKGETVSIGDKQLKGDITVTNLSPSQITTDDVNKIIIPIIGFNVGIQNDPEFYKVQLLMLKAAEAIGNVNDKSFYLNLKNALNKEENRGDFYDGGTKLGATQQMIVALKKVFKYKDQNPDIVTSDFIDLLKTKVK